MAKIDLHIHTTMSDGSLTPKEVIDEAYRNKVNTISIADHDTISAYYTEELFNYAKLKDINLIPGVEISTKLDKIGIHVLGYNFDIQNQNLIKKLEKLRNARHDYLYNVSDKLNNLGYKIDIDELDKIEAVTKAHIAINVINNKENERTLIKEFGHIPNKGEFIETIMNENCKAYVKKETITPKEASDLIKQAGGIVVLAHPVAYKYEDNLNEDKIINIIKDMEISGIESDYIYVDRNNNIINEISKWRELAKNNDLFTTIGSDFHNKDCIRPEIGFKNYELEIEEKREKEIIKKITKI